MAYFLLTSICGPSWDDSRGRREQDAWDQHAAFMNGLVDDGFVLLGGPVGDGEKAMLLVEAGDEGEVRARLGEDPWATAGLLTIGELQPWSLWLGGPESIASG